MGKEGVDVGVIGEIQEAVKAFGEIAVKPLMAVAAASAFLLFVPREVLGILGVDKLLEVYRSWVGVALVISVAYLCAHAGRALSTSVLEWRAGKKLDGIRIGWLRTLTPDEKACLRPYIQENRASVSYALQNGVVGGLVGKNILYRASNMGSVYGFDFNLQPWARDMLNAHPECIDSVE